MKNYSTLILLIFVVFSIKAQKIDRRAVVERHNVTVTKFDTLASLSVGNGHFAFTVDATGLQSFPEYYAKGVPLGTQSDWGWHSFPNTENYKFEETLKDYDFDDRKVAYSVQKNDTQRSKDAVNYYRVNPHRLQLGNIGFEFYKKNGKKIEVADIQSINQKINLWKGEIKSKFLVDGKQVEVLMFCHPKEDKIFVNVKSELLKSQQIKIRLRFPFPSGEFVDEGVNWKNSDKHFSYILSQKSTSVSIKHQLDSTTYFVDFQSENSFKIRSKETHYFVLEPSNQSDSFNFSFHFREKKKSISKTQFSFSSAILDNQIAWKNFWTSGGAVDFSATKDSRAKEIERRVVLSQYLTKIQCAGNQPPQETGLTYNSWFGRPHLEMHWWHGVHFAQWGRPELLQQSVDWYRTVAPKALEIAQRQGYEGVRWQKMTDPVGFESPSSVGAFLIWQQPHYIYLTELLYRKSPTKQILDKYKDLVFKTADFMADYVYYDKEKGRYNLGKGLIPAQECFKPEETFNPTFELTYWHYILNVAQKWRERSGLPRNKKWDEVIKKLSPLPQKDGVYLATESRPDSYTNPDVMIDHPAVLMAYGFVPKTPLLNKHIMQKTYDIIQEKWNWGHTWGWDFPMVAMTATRLNQPEAAVKALLMDIQTNTYLPNGHNYQDKRLRIYLPGNGGVLTAVALMCTGSDENPTKNLGFPKDWKVKWEGLKRIE